MMKGILFSITVLVAILYTASACCSCKHEYDELERNIIAAIERNCGSSPPGPPGLPPPGLPPQPPPASSCADILNANKDAKSGIYEIFGKKVYCHMGSLPGCGGGGWQRIAFFDRRKGTKCPPGFHDYTSQGKVACRRSNVGCQSVTFKAEQSYTRVCGRVQGYQIGSGDAFKRYNSAAGNIKDINTAYLDGVSITYGPPRKHLWSYVASQGSQRHIICPCTGLSTENPSIPPFVTGNSYYCEGGTGKGVQNVLWDGIGCTSLENKGCCNRANMPWFHQKIQEPTAIQASVELRLCSDEGVGNEMFPIFQYEFYIQ